MSRAAIGSGKKRAHERAASRVVKRGRTGRNLMDAEAFSPGERLVIRKGKKAVGVVISMEELRYFEELEDRLDVRDAEKALADPARIPYIETRKKLGL